MIDIHYDNFETELIGASMQTPVLLDIWAPWCGPCKQLGPVLEQLEVDYGGRFILAKLNADEVSEIASQLSQMFGVRSIPFCVMFVQGQPVDGFVGAMPQAQIQAFLDKYVPPEGEGAGGLPDASAEAPASDETQADPAVNDPVAALEHALAQRPNDEELRLTLLRALIERGDVAAAQAVFAPVEALGKGPVPHARISAHGHYLAALVAAQTARSVDDLRAVLATQPRQFDVRFELAQVHFGQSRFTQAMDELLEIIMRDKTWHDELARKTYVAILEVMTKPVEKPAATPGGNTPASKDKPALEIAGKVHVPASDPVIDQYRRKLSMALF